MVNGEKWTRLSLYPEDQPEISQADGRDSKKPDHSIRISHDTYQILMRLKGKMIEETGFPTSLSDIISMLLIRSKTNEH